VGKLKTVRRCDKCNIVLFKIQLGVLTVILVNHKTARPALRYVDIDGKLSSHYVYICRDRCPNILKFRKREVVEK